MRISKTHNPSVNNILQQNPILHSVPSTLLVHRSPVNIPSSWCLLPSISRACFSLRTHSRSLTMSTSSQLERVHSLCHASRPCLHFLSIMRTRFGAWGSCATKTIPFSGSKASILLILNGLATRSSRSSRVKECYAFTWYLWITTATLLCLFVSAYI